MKTLKEIIEEGLEEFDLCLDNIVAYRLQNDDNKVISKGINLNKEDIENLDEFYILGYCVILFNDNSWLERGLTNDSNWWEYSTPPNIEEILK